MLLARSASLLVAFSLLTSTATAHAECAWVLWQEIAVGAPRMEEVWTLAARRNSRARMAQRGLPGGRSEA